MAENYSAPWRRGAVAAFGAAVLATGIVPVATGVASAETTTGGDMTFLATHEWAASQPTFAGQRIVDLEIDSDGHVWAGYGDYGANTGPIVLARHSVEVGAGFEPMFTMDTEAAYNLRSLGDDLVVPATDPRSKADFAVGSPWSEARPLGATHVFDTASLDGTDRWMVGSKGKDAVAWRTADGGMTWSEMIRVAPSEADDFSRFYFAASVGGTMRVQAVGNKSGADPNSLVFDGTAWSEQPSLLPDGGAGWEPTEFNGGVVYHASGHGHAGPIYFFDGSKATQVADGYDFSVAAGRLWVLTDAALVASTADLDTWIDEFRAPAGARSLATNGISAFVGTTSAELWSKDLSIRSEDEANDASTTTTTVVDSPDLDDGNTDEPHPSPSEPPRRAARVRADEGKRGAAQTDGPLVCSPGLVRLGRC